MTKEVKTMVRDEPWGEKAKNLLLTAFYCAGALLLFNGLGTAIDTLVLGGIF